MPVRREASVNAAEWHDQAIVSLSSDVATSDPHSKSSYKAIRSDSADTDVFEGDPSNSTPLNSKSFKKAKMSPSKIKLFSASAIKSETASMSDRALLAQEVVLAGLAVLDKKAFEQRTGITVKKQSDLLRQDGKGLVYKALMEVPKGL